MVFTSLPLYHLDPPNWNQTNQHQVPSNDSPHHLMNHQLISSSQSPAGQAQAQPAGSTGSGSRPGSMAERARMAKIPQPEQALKCPRCDSTNTKFCYFNNYSLSQPRHFCKTCRRYWTRGGALRNVPVGGGCRRNKRSGGSGNKSSSNKSAGANNNSSAAAANSSSSSCSTATSGSAAIPSNFAPALPFLSSLHPLADHYGSTLGLNFTSLHQHQHQSSMDAGDYQVGPGSGGANSTSMGLDQWRIQQIQQFPFLSGLDGPVTGGVTGLYPNFDGDMSKVMSSTTTSGLITQLASVKMEDSRPHGGGMSLPRQYLGMPGNDQYLGGGGGGWAGDLSGFNSSSGNIL